MTEEQKQKLQEQISAKKAEVAAATAAAEADKALLDEAKALGIPVEDFEKKSQVEKPKVEVKPEENKKPSEEKPKNTTQETAKIMAEAVATAIKEVNNQKPAEPVDETKIYG